MTPRPIITTILAVAFALVFAGEAVSQTTLDDPLDDRSSKRLDRMEKVMRELRAIVFQGRETGQPIVVQPAETENQIAGLTDRLNDLEQTLTRLNGQLDASSHDLDQARRDAAALRSENSELKDRLTQLEQKVQTLATPPPPPPEETAQAPAAAAPEDPAAAFAAAKAQLRTGDYATAEASFRDFVDRYGDTARGPEARYYLAKTLRARSAFADAATADIGAIRGWPQTSWAPDAVLDLSRSLIDMKKPADACQTLAELARRYPKASADVKNRAAAARAAASCQ